MARATFPSLSDAGSTGQAPSASASQGPRYHLVKRGMDLLGAGIGLVISLPIIAACALWILLTDGRPVLYSQWRVGREGWMFRIYKLRTMRRRAEAHGDAQFAAYHDPRILRGGGWMRRTHVDELPQLWNILAGQMSLVGPRPERPEMVEQLRRSIPGIDRRLRAQPGLTGLAQVSNGYTNDIAGARRKLTYDLLYLRRRSLREEFRLILRTIPKLWDRSTL